MDEDAHIDDADEMEDEGENPSVWPNGIACKVSIGSDGFRVFGIVLLKHFRDVMCEEYDPECENRLSKQKKCRKEDSEY